MGLDRVVAEDFCEVQRLHAAELEATVASAHKFAQRARDALEATTQDVASLCASCVTHRRNPTNVLNAAEDHLRRNRDHRDHQYHQYHQDDRDHLAAHDHSSRSFCRVCRGSCAR